MENVTEKQTATQAKHTPGPWRVYDINNDPRIVAPDGFPVAVAEETGVLPEWDKKLKIAHWAQGEEGVSHLHRSDDEVVANAHLIAAAPDLLHALAYMAGVYECSCPDECVPDCAMAVARAAIAKAEGR